MSDEVVAALIGLAGGFVGSGVTVFLAFRQQRKERAAQRAADAEERAKRAKVVARVLLADLLVATNRLRLAVDRYGKYWSPRFALPTEPWFRHREQLARDMSLGQWDAVRAYYRSLVTVELQAEGARKRTKEDRPELTEKQRKQIGIAQKRSEGAERALKDFSGDDVQAVDTEDDESDAFVADL